MICIGVYTRVCMDRGICSHVAIAMYDAALVFDWAVLGWSPSIMYQCIICVMYMHMHVQYA